MDKSDMILKHVDTLADALIAERGASYAAGYLSSLLKQTVLLYVDEEDHGAVIEDLLYFINQRQSTGDFPVTKF